MRAAICIVALLVCRPSWAQDAKKLHGTKTFQCIFSVNAYAAMESDNPRLEIRREEFSLTFDQIDGAAGKGRMIGNQGGEDVTVVPAPEAITMIEVLGSGLLQITVIYAAQKSDGQFKAVHSRHSAMFGGMPVPSQYYGACRALL